MEEFFKLDTVRVLTRQEFCNPKIVITYEVDAEYIKARYNCGIMWHDEKLKVVGFKFRNKAHLQDLLQQPEKLVNKQAVWDFYNRPPDTKSRIMRLIEQLRNGDGPTHNEDDDD
jgi:hypothetical protein